MLAANKYKPSQIRLLFIAEAPPAAPDRYFYFEHVHLQDSLWVETMSALYPDFGSTNVERVRKPFWLARFRDDGCFLIDAVEDPMPKGATNAARVRIVEQHADELVRRVQALNPANTLLVSASVWRGASEAMRSARVPVVQHQLVPFPGNGQQARFHQLLSDLGVRGIVGSG